MCDAIVEVGKNRQYQAAMMVAIGISSRDTFNRWRKEYPEFQEAYEAACIHAQAQDEQILQAIATGQLKGNALAQLTIMHNRYGDDWHRAQTNGGGTHIENLQINNIKQLDNKSLDDRISELSQTTEIKQLLNLQDED